MHSNKKELRKQKRGNSYQENFLKMKKLCVLLTNFLSDTIALYKLQ